MGTKVKFQPTKTKLNYEDVNSLMIQSSSIGGVLMNGDI